MTDAFISYLAHTGYYARGYAMAYDGYYKKARRGTYVKASRQAVRICPRCGDERIIYHSHVVTEPVKRLCQKCSNKVKALVLHRMRQNP